MRNRKNRNIRWQVPFRTIKDRPAVINIYDEDFQGELVDLEAALNPISTEDDSNEEFLSPIRSQTGYLRVIDNEDLEGLAPRDNMQHYVELYIDDVLEWCGYMQADAFSEDWDTTPLEVEFPLISGIGALDGLYLDPEKGFGDIRLSSMLRECFDMACIDYEYVYIPAEIFAVGDDFPALMRLDCSRFNFFSEAKAEMDDLDYEKYEGRKASDVISDICTFLGWSLYERGKDIYIVNHGGNGKYHKIPYSNFGKGLISWSNIDNTVSNLQDLEFDGDSDTKDILQGFNLFKIDSDFNAVGDVVPKIDDEALGKKGLLTIDYRTSMGVIARQERIKIFGGGNTDADTEMFQYEAKVIGMVPGTEDVEKIEINPTPFDEKLYYKRIGCCLGEYDLYEMTDKPNKKNYDYKKALVINLLDENKHGVPTLSGTKYPIVKMRNSRCARYVDGAFVFRISASNALRGIREVTMNDVIKSFDFIVTFQCGNKFWDGTQWIDVKKAFKIHVDNDGKIKDMKTLDMPYNGAAGYIMPITCPLSGNVEMTLYANGDYGFDKDIDRIYVSGLVVEYYPDDNTISDKKDKSNKYQAKIDYVFENEKELNLNLATMNKNTAGYGFLMLDGAYVTKLYYPSTNETIRPENHLLGKLKRVYGRSIEKLTIDVENNNLLPYDFLAYGNKRYEIVSRKTEWSDEHQSLTLMDVQ